MRWTTWLNFPAFPKELRQLRQVKELTGSRSPRVATYKRQKHSLVSKSFSQWCPCYPLAASGIWCGLLSLSCPQVCPLTPEPATGPAYVAEFTVPPEDKPTAARRKERTLRSLSKTGTWGGGAVRTHVLLGFTAGVRYIQIQCIRMICVQQQITVIELSIQKETNYNYLIKRAQKALLSFIK